MTATLDETATHPHAELQAGVASGIDTYLNLSHGHAAQGNTRLAVLAVWAADVQTLQSLLWESGLGSAPDPDAALASVAQAVDTSLRDHLAHGEPSTDARQRVQTMRNALTAAFDASVHTLLDERFVSLDHLVGHELEAGATEQALRVRLAGRTGSQLAGDLRLAAADCMAIAAALAAVGRVGDAVQQARLADMASFEAYLVEAATAAGDTTLGTVDLRWEIASAAVDALAEVGQDPAEEVRAVRDTLQRAVGPAESAALLAAFEPVPPLHR